MWPTLPDVLYDIDFMNGYSIHFGNTCNAFISILHVIQQGSGRGVPTGSLACLMSLALNTKFTEALFCFPFLLHLISLRDLYITLYCELIIY